MKALFDVAGLFVQAAAAGLKVINKEIKEHPEIVASFVIDLRTALRDSKFLPAIKEFRKNFHILATTDDGEEKFEEMIQETDSIVEDIDTLLSDAFDSEPEDLLNEAERTKMQVRSCKECGDDLNKDGFCKNVHCEYSSKFQDDE